MDDWEAIGRGKEMCSTPTQKWITARRSRLRNGVLKCLRFLCVPRWNHRHRRNRIRSHLSDSGIKMNDHWNWSLRIAHYSTPNTCGAKLFICCLWIKFVWSFSSNQSTVNTQWLNGLKTVAATHVATAVAIRFCVSIYVKRVRSIHITHTRPRVRESEEKGKSRVCPGIDEARVSHIRRHRMKRSDKLREYGQVQVSPSRRLLLVRPSCWYANW